MGLSMGAGPTIREYEALLDDRQGNIKGTEGKSMGLVIIVISGCF